MEYLTKIQFGTKSKVNVCLLCHRVRRPTWKYGHWQKLIISPCMVSRSLQKWSYSARLPISILCYCFLPFLWFLWWIKISITSKHAGIEWPLVPHASNWTANADGYVLYANKTNVSLADLVKAQMLKFSVDCVFYNYFIAIQAAMHTRQSLVAIDTSSILLITAHQLYKGQSKFMVKKRNLPPLLNFPHFWSAFYHTVGWETDVVICGKPAVTWLDASANHRHSAFLIPHFTFRIPHSAIPNFTHSRTAKTFTWYCTHRGWNS